MTDWSPDTRRVLRAYLRAIAVSDPLQREFARRHGIALGDAHALRALRDLGEVPISRLAAALGIKPSSATNLVDRLESAGLVERCANPADRRVITLRLTDRAREALSDRALVERSGLVRRVERLTSDERLLLASLLERMLEHRPEDDAAPDGAPAATPAEPQPPVVAGSGGPSTGAAGAERAR